jgi:hypothetical protein
VILHVAFRKVISDRAGILVDELTSPALHVSERAGDPVEVVSYGFEDRILFHAATNYATLDRL